MEEDTRAHVYNLHKAICVRLDQYILWFEVSVYDMQFMQSGQCSEYLLRNHLQLAKREELRFRPIGLIQIFLEELGEYHEMLAMVEVIIHIDETSFIGIAVGLYISQQFDLIQCLVHVILVVQDHLQAIPLFLVGCSEIFDFYCFGELSLAKHTDYLKPTGQNFIDDYGDFSLLLEASFLSIVNYLQFMTVIYDSIGLQGIDICVIDFYLTKWVLLLSKLTLGGSFVGILSKAL